MLRIAWSVFLGISRHVTQRGNRREVVYFSAEVRLVYLKWLGEFSRKHVVEILAYCLMSNHVYLILKPKTDEGLQNILKPLHKHFAQQINRAKGWKEQGVASPLITK